MSMKYSRLGAIAGAALATAAGTAQAVNIATDDVGEVIVGSYYTAQPGFQTLINLTNTQNVPVVVKVRIHEALNSRDVLDYTIGLSGFDVYTGVIREVSDNGETKVVLRNTDQLNPAKGNNPSCTIPQTVAAGGGVNFNPASDLILQPAAYGGQRLSQDGNTAGLEVDGDAGPEGVDRLREGYIEILSVGYADVDLATDVNVGPNMPISAGTGADSFVSGELIDLADAIENHKCNRFQASFSNLVRTGGTRRIVDSARQMGEPINALKGNFRVLNIGNGTESDVPALTLANFYNGAEIPADPTAALGTGVDAGWTVMDSWTQQCTVTRGDRRDNPATSWAPGDRAVGGNCNNLVTKQTPFAFLEPTLNDAFPAVANVTLDGPNANFALAPATTSLAARARGVDAVSTLIQRKAVINEWASRTFDDGTVGTDWVITMPTKLFYVDAGIGPQAAIYASFQDPNNAADFRPASKVRPEAILAGTIDGNNIGPNVFGPTATNAYAPFAEAFRRFAPLDPATAGSCVEVGISVYDRAEVSIDGPDLGDGTAQSPAPPRPRDVADLCYEVNVVSFDGRDGGLGHSDLLYDLDIDTTELNNRAGWMRLELGFGPDAAGAFLSNNLAGTATNVTLRGLPVVGFALKERSYGDATQNYSSTAAHAYTREVRNGTAVNSPVVLGFNASNALLTGAVSQ